MSAWLCLVRFRWYIICIPISDNRMLPRFRHTWEATQNSEITILPLPWSALPAFPLTDRDVGGFSDQPYIVGRFPPATLPSPINWRMRRIRFTINTTACRSPVRVEFIPEVAVWVTAADRESALFSAAGTSSVTVVTWWTDRHRLRPIPPSGSLPATSQLFSGRRLSGSIPTDWRPNHQQCNRHCHRHHQLYPYGPSPDPIGRRPPLSPLAFFIVLAELQPVAAVFVIANHPSSFLLPPSTYSDHWPAFGHLPIAGTYSSLQQLPAFFSLNSGHLRPRLRSPSPPTW